MMLPKQWENVGLTTQQVPYKMERPAYSTPPPVENTPANNECRMVELRGSKVASFQINNEQFICLPQAFDLFLKHLVGGLHTVYTKLKRLSIQPVVCNVEQVRILRGKGAIQPGVNRCKLITKKDFETLYQDCTTASRPGRPPKRYPMLPPTDLSNHNHHGNNMTSQSNSMINPVDLFQHNKRFRLDKISQQEHAKTDRKTSISPNKDENQGGNQSGLNNSDIPNSSAAQLAYFQALHSQYRLANNMQNGGNMENNSHINPLILNMFNPQQQALMINQFNQMSQMANGRAFAAAAQIAANNGQSGLMFNPLLQRQQELNNKHTNNNNLKQRGGSDDENSFLPTGRKNSLGNLTSSIGCNGTEKSSNGKCRSSSDDSATGHKLSLGNYGNTKAHHATNLKNICEHKINREGPTIENILVKIQSMVEEAKNTAVNSSVFYQKQISELKLQIDEESQKREQLEKKLFESNKNLHAVSEKLTREKETTKTLSTQLCSLKHFLNTLTAVNQAACNTENHRNNQASNMTFMNGDVQARSSEGSSPRSSNSPKEFASQQQMTPRSSPASVASTRVNQISNESGNSRSPSPQCKKRRFSMEGGKLEGEMLTSASSIAMNSATMSPSSKISQMFSNGTNKPKQEANLNNNNNKQIEAQVAMAFASIPSNQTNNKNDQPTKYAEAAAKINKDSNIYTNGTMLFKSNQQLY